MYIEHLGWGNSDAPQVHAFGPTLFGSPHPRTRHRRHDPQQPADTVLISELTPNLDHEMPIRQGISSATDSARYGRTARSWNSSELRRVIVPRTENEHDPGRARYLLSPTRFPVENAPGV